MRRLTLLAVYDVQLQGKVSEELAGLVAVDLSSAELASGVTIYGELRLRQGGIKHFAIAFLHFGLKSMDFRWCSASK